MSSNPIYNFFATPGSFGPFFLRMALSVVFFFHGTQKAFGWFGGNGWTATIATWTSESGLNIPYIFAALAIAIELLVVVSLFLGIFTRLGGLGICVIMSGALYLVHGGGGFAEVEYPVMLLASGLALMFFGGGYFSIDRAISSNLLPAVG